MPPELRLSRAAGALREPVDLWWRDDDAGRPHPCLERLLDLARTHNLPIALAVVPGWLEEACARLVDEAAQAVVLQHGWSHESHAHPNHKSVELGGTADPEGLAAHLVRGRCHLHERFGSRFLPVMVPPWNRAEADFVAALPRLGFRGISLFGGQDAGGNGLVRIDTHLDLVDWRASRGFIGLNASIEALTGRLEQHRAGPIGILTHHRLMQAADLDMLGELLRVISAQPNLRWRAAAQLFAGAA